MKNLLVTKSSDCKSDLDASRLFAIIMSWIFITPATSIVCHFVVCIFSGPCTNASVTARLISLTDPYRYDVIVYGVTLRTPLRSN